ncbi:PH domain-containing protein, partial [Paenibacillus darwinianus]
TIRYGSFSAHLALIPKKRVQWYGTTVSPLQMRRELTSFAVAVASGSGQADFRIRYMTEQSGLELTEWLRRKD